ncbi:hypothetical protein DXG03_008067 [Asterophora parasitica]|uniref:F-box domain-containing protein n=1 Tax=Asterophora parasitica TaxID=117018 RepID=A0A9P7G0F4_9AGAR|nr:hypothetical protein DXG03_008067 [Asterophora parasitica]
MGAKRALPSEHAMTPDSLHYGNSLDKNRTSEDLVPPKERLEHSDASATATTSDCPTTSTKTVYTAPVAPIAAFASEVLCLIFAVACAKDDLTHENLATALSLSRVCRLWRDIMLDTANRGCWSSFILTDEHCPWAKDETWIPRVSNVLSIYLARSQDHPLDITASASYESGAFWHPERGWEDKFEIFRKQFLPHAARWRTLVTVNFALGAFKVVKTPMLQDLDVVLTEELVPSQNLTALFPIIKQSPALESLTLRNFSYGDFFFPPRQTAEGLPQGLRTFTTHDFMVSESLECAVAVAALRTLTILDPQTDGDDEPEKRYIHPTLVHLSVRVDQRRRKDSRDRRMAIVHPLQQLTAPSLESFTVRLHRVDIGEAKALREMCAIQWSSQACLEFMSHSPQLTRLVLNFGGVTLESDLVASEVIELLKTLPALEEFEFGEPKGFEIVGEIVNWLTRFEAMGKPRTEEKFGRAACGRGDKLRSMTLEGGLDVPDDELVTMVGSRMVHSGIVAEAAREEVDLEVVEFTLWGRVLGGEARGRLVALRGPGHRINAE